MHFFIKTVSFNSKTKLKFIYFLLFVFSCCFLTNCNKNQKRVECGDTVTLAYKITDKNGLRLDESFLHQNFNKIEKSELFRFKTCNNEVIQGWDSVILGCKTKKIYTFDIPAKLAYNDCKIYNDIPAGSNIILKFKIFKIN